MPPVTGSFNVYIPITTDVMLGARARERLCEQVRYQGVRGKIPGIIFRDAKIDFWCSRDGVLPAFVHEPGVEYFQYHCADGFPVACRFDVQFFRAPQHFPPFRPQMQSAGRDFLVHMLRTSIAREVTIVANTPKALRTRAYHKGLQRGTPEPTVPAWRARYLHPQAPSLDNTDPQPILTQKEPQK